jgi:hypothetical protein
MGNFPEPGLNFLKDTETTALIPANGQKNRLEDGLVGATGLEPVTSRM